MASLLRLWEQTKPGRDFWDNKKDLADLDEDAMQVVIRGLEIRPDRTDGNTFWDDFIAVLGNNSEGASHLLGVNRDVVAGWTSKIREALKRVRDENTAPEDQADMVQTGDRES